MRRVLVIEANEALRQSLMVGLRGWDIEAEAVREVAEAGLTLASGPFDAVVLGPTGGKVTELSGALESLSSHDSPPEVVAMVAGGTDEGLRALRHGAADFVLASAGVEPVAIALQKIEARRASTANSDRRALRSGGAPGEAADAGVRGNGPKAGRGAADGVARVASEGASRRKVPVLIGASPKIIAVLNLVRRLAPVRAGVLVGGESGTGKELVAEALHDESPWRAGPFIAVNCGAIPAGLIESELFGHVRGAFTDAVRDKQGLFQAADGGTLFLDEIADLPLALQPKLLRALQEGMVRRVGDVEDVRVDVRVVAATARDLPREVAARQFREDLYYRLAALTIQLPPLRERREDIALLAEHFLVRVRARLGVAVRDIEPAALQVLTAYAWPGNVRELENTVERAAVLCSGDVIDVASLPERMLPPGGVDGVPARAAGAVGGRPPDAGGPGEQANGAARDGASLDAAELSIKRTSRRMEEELIQRALGVTGGNRTRAAELLEISHRALLYKIKEYGIAVATGREAAAKADGRPGKPVTS